jgi:type II secretory pathway pseudopilin PulG
METTISLEHRQPPGRSTAPRREIGFTSTEMLLVVVILGGLGTIATLAAARQENPS